MSDGRNQSITSVISTYSRRLFGFIRGRVHSEEDAEDILQDVWVSLNNVVDLDAIDNISAWLFRNARNLIIDRYRKKRDVSLEDQLSEESIMQGLMLSSDELPEDDLFQEAFWAEMMSALEELPAKQRDVFVRNELDGMTLQEIADERGEKLKTIISRKRYAVQQLRIRLQEIYDELNDQ